VLTGTPRSTIITQKHSIQKKFAEQSQIMGCGASSSPGCQAAAISREIDEQLKNEFYATKGDFKILLLGAGGGGKSTIAKQMRIIYDTGYSSFDRMQYRAAVHSNAIQSLLAILREMEILHVPFSGHSRAQDVRRLSDMSKDSNSKCITIEMGKLMISLWHDDATQRFFTQSKEYLVTDSVSYFLSAISRISQPLYIPTEKDVLKARVSTTGVVETLFICKDVRFRMIDVGGQRSQRKHWLHCFANVTCIIFCAALSEYDMFLEEDSRINRMDESLNLFEYICTNKWLLNTPIVLFLNKTDLLQEKIQRSPLTICFPNYNGPNTYNSAIDHIKKKFENLHPKKLKLYIHLTCAVDTTNIQWVFDIVSDIIIRLNHRECGLS
jgi:GTPase SAR1 family protein